MLDSKLKIHTGKELSLLESTKENARRVLMKNFEATGGEYITPAWPHYKNQWVWDSAFHAIACMHLELKDLAINEIKKLFEFQDDRGFIPHRIYHEKFVWFDLERPLYNRGGWHPSSSSLVGQPVLAQAVEAIGDDDFTAEIIENLVAFYMYFIKYRDALNVLSIISPRESGRDAAPEFDFFRPIAPKRLRFLENILDPVGVLKLHSTYGLRYKLPGGGWDERRILKSCLFNVKDVAMHSLWIDGLYSLKNLLSRVNREELFPEINEVIKKATEALIEKSWDKQEKVFYPIRVTKRGEKKIKMLSLGSIFPLLLKDLPQNIVEDIVENITNTEKFWTPYPVPVVPRCNEKFEPITPFPIWASGQVWVNVLWFLIRGLMNHGYDDVAKTIAEKAITMVEDNGIWEFYNSITGEGMRVKDFGWSTLVVSFPDLISLNK